MKCYKCDRCGEVFSGSGLTLVDFWTSGRPTTQYELCHICGEWIRVALSNKESEVGRDDT